MKNCSYCGRKNADSNAACDGCGQPLPAPPVEIKIEPPPVQLLPPKIPASSGLFRGAFCIREPDATTKLGYKIFNTKSLGAIGIVTVHSGLITLTQKRLRVKILLLVLITLVGLVAAGAGFSLTSSFPVVAMVAAIYIALSTLIVRMRTRQWQFPLSRIVNVHIPQSPKNALEFVVLPDHPDTARNEECSFIIFIPVEPGAALALAQLLPRTVSHVADPVKKDAADFAQHARLATPRIWVTPTLIGLNFVVFILSCHANFLSPTAATMLDWGADWGPLTTSGEWWRLLTACFLHFGIVHLLCNMYALLIAGLLAERLFGNWFYLVIYLGAGLASSLTSLRWHPELISAGASGAIFGVYGALLGYLANQRGTVPPVVFSPLVRSAATFVGYNLVYALTQKNIDQAAHLGGLLSGTIFGFIAARPVQQPRRQEVTRLALIQFVGSLIILLLPLSFAAPEFQPKFAQMLNSMGASFANGSGVPKDGLTAAKWYRKAASHGSAEAEFNLGGLYFNGALADGTKDPEEAVKWYRQAADHGLPQAEVVLGAIYYNGEGVQKDYTEAMNWMRKAADRGTADDEYFVGIMYLKGQGTERNEAAALPWFRKAADHGLIHAQTLLASMYYQGDGIEKDFPEAAIWARKAADQGDANSQLLLSALYAAGEGVEQDDIQARAWLRVAVGSGAQLGPGAARLQKFLEQKMTPDQLAKSKSLAEQLRKKIVRTTPK